MDEVLSNGIKGDVKKKAFRLCQEFLSAQWSEATLDDFSISIVSGGFMNQLYLCRLSERARAQVPGAVPNEVLFRIYGWQQEDAACLVAEAATFVLLSEKGLGPRLYGVFPNGRLEQYVPSRILSSNDIRQFSTTIAREMAKIHALPVPVRKVPDFFPVYTRKFLDEIQKSTSSKRSEAITLTESYPTEMEWLWGLMKKTDSPVVYCHNDLQGGNILLREDVTKNKHPSLMLIDFEFGSYNYRGFDVGNQFCEWCFDYNTKEYPHFTVNFDKYPSKQEQIDYIEAYLKQMQTEGGLDKNASIAKETEKLLKEVMVYRLASHLVWSTWSYKTSLNSQTGGFAHMEYGKTRFQGYLKYKRELLNSTFYKEFSTNENGHDL